MNEKSNKGCSTRRNFLGMGLGLTATSVLARMGAAQDRSSRTGNTPGKSSGPVGRRRLGRLEVSSLGLGVQNMSRKYETTVPYRPEMINIIRAAFDRGVTFYDAAEAYGPHEVERILGEGVAPFRDEVQIATKFGFNVDLETGERRPGATASPITLSVWSRGC